MSTDAEERRKSIYEHPKFIELRKAGIKNETQIENVVITYLKLIEVHLWYDVEMVVLNDEQVVFVKGRKNCKVIVNVGLNTSLLMHTFRDQSFEYVLPVGMEMNHSVESFEESVEQAQKNGCTSDSILIASVDETSSLLFYRISKGLVPPKETVNRQVGRSRIPEWNEQQGKWKFV